MCESKKAALRVTAVFTRLQRHASSAYVRTPQNSPPRGTVKWGSGSIYCDRSNHLRRSNTSEYRKQNQRLFLEMWSRKKKIYIYTYIYIHITIKYSSQILSLLSVVFQQRPPSVSEGFVLIFTLLAPTAWGNWQSRSNYAWFSSPVNGFSI